MLNLIWNRFSIFKCISKGDAYPSANPCRRNPSNRVRRPLHIRTNHDARLLQLSKLHTVPPYNWSHNACLEMPLMIVIGNFYFMESRETIHIRVLRSFILRPLIVINGARVRSTGAVISRPLSLAHDETKERKHAREAGKDYSNIAFNDAP